MTDLETLLLAAADDNSKEPAFTARLMESEVLVLGELEGDSFAIGTWGDEQGDIVPFFTSEQMIQASAQAMPDMPTDCFTLPCRDFWAATSGHRLVLNAHGPVARVYTPHEVTSLLAGVDPHAPGAEVAYGDSAVSVSPLETEPAALVAELRSKLEGKDCVLAAHLGWVERGDGHTGYLMFVRTTDPDAALADMDSIDPAVLGEHALDVTVIPAEITDHLMAGIAPFYPPAP